MSDRQSFHAHVSLFATRHTAYKLRCRSMWVFLLFLSLQCTRALPSGLPEASSTLLRMHRLYMQQPPHDYELYNILHVSPNATSNDISKAYRRMTRRYHPDKAPDSANLLQQVREAFEVLITDYNRLAYHRYGLKSPSQATLILYGSVPKSDKHTWNLLRLIGYHPGRPPPAAHDSVFENERIVYLATQILERIRPLVEESIDKTTMITILTEEFDRLKRLPMGAQILRCVGRAYRFSGRQFLKRQKLRVVPLPQKAFELTESMRSSIRSAKHLFTAALASGHVLFAERQVKSAASLTNSVSSNNDKIENIVGELGGLNEDFTNDVPTDEEIKLNENLKAKTAVADSLSVEALWKVKKIEIDQVLRKACDMILQGDYFFFPSHQKLSNPRRIKEDGWVGSSRKVVTTHDAKVKAAAALELIGDLMVERSKEDTAWME